MSNEMALVIRCVNSTMVWPLALAPTTLPSQSGHLLPQPAPEPLALTYAPQRTTSTFQYRAVHAKRATGGISPGREWESRIAVGENAGSRLS